MKTFFGEHHDFGTEFIGTGIKKKTLTQKRNCESCVALYLIYKSALRKLRCASLISETRCALVRCASFNIKDVLRCASLISKTHCALVRYALLIYGKMPPLLILSFYMLCTLLNLSGETVYYDNFNKLLFLNLYFDNYRYFST